MKIAVLTSGVLPVPAVLGGAVENLIDYYLEYNNQHQLHDITVYSIAPPKGTSDVATSHTHYHYIDTTSWWGRLKRHIYVQTHKSVYYNPYIEYFFYEALKDIAKKEFDIVILENRPGFSIDLSKISSAKIIIHLHNDLLNNNSQKASEICQVSHKVITVSKFIKSKVETIKSNIPIETVYNGIDLQNFYHAAAINRNELGLKKEDFILVYSGRLIKEKGIEELIDAIIQLRLYPSIKLLILGGSFYGIGHDNAFINRLKEKCKKNINRIVFTGFIPYEKLPQYLKIADVAVVPSTWEEPFGLTCVEAIATGLPLITTNSGGIPEIINNQCAILIDKTNLKDELSKAILDLYNNRNLRHKMRNAGIKNSLKFCKENYSKYFLTNLTTDI